MAKSISKYTYLFFLSLLIFYCKSKKNIILVPSTDQVQINKYVKLLNTQYPDSFALTQRIILDIVGKQYDFIGQLTMDRSNAFRAMVFGEMGGQFIDLLAKGDSISILANPTDLPEKPILQGVTNDIEQVFFYQNCTKLNTSDSSKDTIEIIIDTPDGYSQYSIDKIKNRILNLKFYSGNKLIRSAEFLEYKMQDMWDREIPTLIFLINHRWRYSLEVRLLQISNQYDKDKVFKTN